MASPKPKFFQKTQMIRLHCQATCGFAALIANHSQLALSSITQQVELHTQA